MAPFSLLLLPVYKRTHTLLILLIITDVHMVMISGLATWYWIYTYGLVSKQTI